MMFLFTCIPIKYHNQTPFMENLNPNCDKSKNTLNFKLQNENETKNKNLSM